jgi:cell division protein FtsN
MFVGILIGLVFGVGISAALAIYVSGIPNPFAPASGSSEHSPKPTQEAPKALENGAPSAAATPAAGNGQQAAAEKKRFDFYKVLPGGETPMPKNESTPASKTPEEAKTNGAVVKPDEKKAAAAPGTTFFLQAGAYQVEADADNQKAKVALLGYDAQVKSATVADKGTIYRVRLGPFASQEEVNEARGVLKDNGIASSVIKIVKAPPQATSN